jgi:hypothetical protein
VSALGREGSENIIESRKERKERQEEFSTPDIQYYVEVDVVVGKMDTMRFKQKGTDIRAKRAEIAANQIHEETPSIHHSIIPPHHLIPTSLPQ